MLKDHRGDYSQTEKKMIQMTFLIYFSTGGRSVKASEEPVSNKIYKWPGTRKNETFPSVSCDLPKMGYLIEKQPKIN